MKKLLSLVLLLALLAGCTTPAAPANPGTTPDSTAPSASDTAPTEPQGEVPTPVRRDQWDRYQWEVLPYMQEHHIMQQTWEGEPPLVPPLTEGHDTRYRNFQVVNAEKYSDYTELTVEIYDYFARNPYTGDIYDSSPRPEDLRWQDLVDLRTDEENGQLCVGRSIVQVRRGDFDWEYLSCTFTPIENPAYHYLTSVTEKLRPQLEASGLANLDGYSAESIDYVYRYIAARRMIHGPDEITNYDLTDLITTIYADIPLSALNDMGEPLDRNYTFDSAILRLLTGVKEAYITCPISDYSVFADMHQLELLYFWGSPNYPEKAVTAENMAALRVGHTEILRLDDMDIPLLDLTNAGKIDALLISSMFAAIGDFKGCDGIETLYVGSTRTNPQLYNPDNFPDAKNIFLEAYRDYRRTVSYSRLKEFDDTVTIDVALQYYGCDNEALTSLIGANLRCAYLSPYDYRPDLDRSLADQLTAQEIHWDTYPDFYGQLREILGHDPY